MCGGLVASGAHAPREGQYTNTGNLVYLGELTSLEPASLPSGLNLSVSRAAPGNPERPGGPPGGLRTLSGPEWAAWGSHRSSPDTQHGRYRAGGGAIGRKGHL